MNEERLTRRELETLREKLACSPRPIHWKLQDKLERMIEALEPATYKNDPDLAQTPPESGTQVSGSE